MDYVWGRPTTALHVKDMMEVADVQSNLDIALCSMVANSEHALLSISTNQEILAR